MQPVHQMVNGGKAGQSFRNCLFAGFSFRKEQSIGRKAIKKQPVRVTKKNVLKKFRGCTGSPPGIDGAGSRKK